MAHAPRFPANSPRSFFAAHREGRRFVGESPQGKRRSAQKKVAAIENCETKKQDRITSTQPHQPMKHRDKEAATHVTFCTIKRPLHSLLDLHGEPLPKEPNPVGLAMRIAPLFAFLPVPVLFDIQGEDLLIRYPEEPESAKARAAKLARRAAQRADAGDHAGAASLWRSALQRQPSFHTARRRLAHAYVELGDTEKATPILLQVLYCNPEDIWALRALANIWFCQGDCPRAERLMRLALALNPANAQTLNNLAAVCCQTGRKEEGIKGPWPGPSPGEVPARLSRTAPTARPREIVAPNPGSLGGAQCRPEARLLPLAPAVARHA
jgi:tetratricopeptide (TPR) repeat protein